MIPHNLSEFINLLRQHQQLVEITTPVDPYLEIAEIHRRTIAAGGPALLFTNVTGKNFPVITNLFGSEQRVTLAFGQDTVSNMTKLIQLAHNLPPKLNDLWRERRLLTRLLRLGTRRQTTQLNCIPNPDVTTLPALTSWHSDGGAFLTLPLVHSRDVVNNKDNLGIYRMQIYSPTEMGMHFQIGKGGGYHLYQAEQLNRDLEVNVYLGGPPALILAAIAPLPENVPEFLLCSLLLGQKLPCTPNPHGTLDLLNNVEFCLSGNVPAHVRRSEGPFGDHYGYNSLQHDFPTFRPRALFHKKNAVFPATVVGKPRQEDFFLGDYLQKLLLPIIPLVMPGVRDLWSYGETGYHSLAACVLHERHEREALSTAFRILGEGQLALTKFLLCVDHAVNLHDFKTLLTHILQRTDFNTDLHIFARTAMDTLDYSSAQLNKGSKGVLMGLGQPRRTLPHTPPTINNHLVQKLGMFCPGCLVLQSYAHAEKPQIYTDILTQTEFADWPLLVLTDDVDRALQSTGAFLWTTFTRFNPATDIHARQSEHRQHKISYTPPLLIDARLKAWYPPELFCDETTKKQVSHKWKKYFPPPQRNNGRRRRTVNIIPLYHESGEVVKIISLL